MENKIEDQTMQILYKDKIRNINLINFINEYRITGTEIAGDSILVRGTSDQNWVYISSGNLQEFKNLIKSLNSEDKYFAIIEDWMLPYITEGKDVNWILSCMKLYLPEETLLADSNCKIERLNSSDAEYIFENYEYKQYCSVDYIKERIGLGPALGIWKDNKLAAWVMTQDDGAIGLLTVIPEYRRQGLARELMLSIIKELRKAGQVPFVQIEEDNKPSMNLAMSLGFRKDRRIHWVSK